VPSVAESPVCVRGNPEAWRVEIEPRGDASAECGYVALGGAEMVPPDVEVAYEYVVATLSGRADGSENVVLAADAGSEAPVPVPGANLSDGRSAGGGVWGAMWYFGRGVECGV